MNGLITRDGAAYIFNLFTNGESAAPTYYVALVVSAQPGIAVSGDELDEPAVSEYQRGALANVSGNWKIDGGTLINMVDIDFPVVANDWGQIRYWAICDEIDGGRVLFVGTFNTPFIVAIGDQPYVSAQALSIDLGLSEWRVSE